MQPNTPEWVQILFDFPLSIAEINIKWKFPPKKFEIKLKLNLNRSNILRLLLFLIYPNYFCNIFSYIFSNHI